MNGSGESRTRILDPEFLRRQTVGVDAEFQTPFGRRLMVYGDYTASGRCLRFVERYVMHLQRIYANTHTEDDISGRSMTQLMHQAEQTIKDAVHAGTHGKLVAVGAGCTAAIDRFQQIVGVHWAPVTRQLVATLVQRHLGSDQSQALQAFMEAHRPIIFLGPFEHHSNELTWRQGFADVREVKLADDGGLDLEHLRFLLQAEQDRDRLKIGSFSAASNVTGMRTPVHQIARMLHAHGALACFDYAACAPYVEIDMNPEPGPEGGDPSLDAVFISPHKFLGGPGSSGVLVFQERIYHRDLPPSVSGGGTVDYVGLDDQDFTEDIEIREKAGTPGVLQTMKAALAFEVKRAVGVDRIEAMEHAMLEKAFRRWSSNPALEILGNQDPARRIGIVSFNIRDPRGLYLHPRLLTVLLNDLFGIQSRAGCSCAGPYGHRLLGIDLERSERYRKWVQKGYQGIKPGWCRLGFHFTMDPAEVDYILDAVDFLAREGHRFLPLYAFDLKEATWTHKQDPGLAEAFSLQAALQNPLQEGGALSTEMRRRLYRSYLQEAESLASTLASQGERPLRRLPGELGELQFFSLSD
ncbi:MAG: aminotransferase class V-fold PLP-dependent enzyme [Planctomycetota bacterium]|nr:MAG: aminotransferase class V-fold PLP-dependent enzyme [Planctomycetota bacterium]